MPARPRCLRWPRNADQPFLSSFAPSQMPRISRKPSAETPIATSSDTLRTSPAQLRLSTTPSRYTSSRSGVSPSQLFAWRKLYRAGPEIERTVPVPPSVPGFAAVEIAPAMPPSVADAGSVSSGLIEIELAGGERVRISGAPDPAVVAAALRALAGR